MSSLNIRINKTTKQIELEIDNRVVTEEMSEKIVEICNQLFTDSDKFDAEKTFNMIFQYIKGYQRILYSQISNIVYAFYNNHTTAEATNALGTMISNLEKIVAYTGTQKYKSRKEKAQQSDIKKAYEDTEKSIIKIWDHVNLAQTQYSGLKQTDEEYRKKFNNSITPFKESLMKDMNAQLLTMVSIFTALAFLVFGGISSLNGIFSNQETSLLKIMIIGCIWGLFILNLIFIFLFCVGKMTGLSFKPNSDSDTNIFQEYSIIWWSNLILLTILAVSVWTFYVQKENLDSEFNTWCRANPEFAMWAGYLIILFIFLMVLKFLMARNWKKRK